LAPGHPKGKGDEQLACTSTDLAVTTVFVVIGGRCERTVRTGAARSLTPQITWVDLGNQRERTIGDNGAA
jgi:hypothetical protein